MPAVGIPRAAAPPGLTWRVAEVIARPSGITSPRGTAMKFIGGRRDSDTTGAETVYPPTGREVRICA
ncbi:hypothetical protein D3C86_2228620 [compost metagenome]